MWEPGDGDAEHTSSAAAMWGWHRCALWWKASAGCWPATETKWLARLSWSHTSYHGQRRDIGKARCFRWRGRWETVTVGREELLHYSLGASAMNEWKIRLHWSCCWIVHIVKQDGFVGVCHLHHWRHENLLCALTKDLSPSNTGCRPALRPVMELMGHPSPGPSGTGLIRAYLAAGLSSQ